MFNLKKIKLTRGYEAIVDDEDYNMLNQSSWHCSTRGYAIQNITVGGKRGKLFMHSVVNNTPNGLYTDHINRDKLDNRKSNLRSCTPSQNQMNRVANKNNKLGLKGISWDKGTKKFRAQIQLDTGVKNLGCYDTVEIALTVYNKMAKKHFGEFYNKNQAQVQREF